MKMPIHNLEDLIDRSSLHPLIKDILDDIHKMATRFLRKTKGKKKNAESLGRLTSHADHARKRDENTCVLTRAAIVEMAHVFPFSATSSPSAVSTTQGLFDVMHWIMGSAFIERNKSIVKLRGTEAKWNIFGLDRKVHSWLDEGLVAFQSMGVEEETQGYRTSYKTRLKFHFLPKCEFEGNAETTEQIEATLSAINSHLYDQQQQGLPARQFDGPGYIGTFFPSGERVKSGSICYITHEEPEDAYKSADIILLQWECMVLLMMAGE